MVSISSYNNFHSKKNKIKTTTSTPSKLKKKRTFAYKERLLEEWKRITSVGGNLWGSKQTRSVHYIRVPPTVKAKDCNESSSTHISIISISEDSNTGGGEVDECFKGNSLDCNAVSKECIMSSEDANVRAESNNTTHTVTSDILERVQSNYHGEETSQSLGAIRGKCSDVSSKGETIPSKRKSTMGERLCFNVVETSGPSKKIRGIDNVDQPTSKSNVEKSCARNKEDSERSQLNNVETKKIREQQKTLHLSLKPDIEKLCKILLLPDNVKSMVERMLEYTLNNNYKICTEPVLIKQAFQLSLCLTAASLLKHKLDTEASLILAKKHLNFDCKKDKVDEINVMWDRVGKFLLLIGNSNVTGSPKASESSYRVKNQWRKLLEMQLESKNNIKKDIETKEAYLARWHKVELAAYKNSDYVMTKEKLKDFNGEYEKRLAELKRKHEVRLQTFETEMLKARQKFQESWALDKVSETSREWATTSELSREEAVGLPSTIKSTDDPKNATPLISLSTDKKSDAGLERVASSRPCSSSSPSNGRPVIISPVNQPNHVSTVMEPPEQVQQLPSSRFLSSDQQLQSASRNVLPMCNVPHGDELERIRKQKLVFKDEFQKKWKELDTQETIVRANKILANTMNAKFDPKFSGASGVLQDASFSRLPRINSITSPSGNLQAGGELRAPAPHNQPCRYGRFTQLLSQPSRQQNATWPSMLSSSSSHGPPVATLQNSHTSTGSHSVVQASGNLQAGLEIRAPALHLPSYRPSGNLQAGLEIRAPALHLPSYRPSGNLQAGLEICAPAPHLLSYRPTSQPAPSYSPASSSSFFQGLPTMSTTISQVGTHRGAWYSISQHDAREC